MAAAYGTISVDAKTAGDLYLDGERLSSLRGGGTVRLDGVEAGGHELQMHYTRGGLETLAVTVEKERSVAASFAFVPLVDMVLVEGGTFQLGDTAGGGEDNERPVHSVTVSSYYLGKHEVTQKQWVAVMGTNPSNFRGENLPVEQVGWFDAVDFCNRLSVKEGLQPCYTISGTSVSCDFSKNGYRLPTEAEWEYAAKGGRSSDGYVCAGGNDLDAVGWYNGNSGSTTHPVGGKQANELGLYDMSGNVWEWCWDWYGSYGSGAQTDPRGPSSGQYRLMRGGSWLDSVDASNLRASYRNRNVPGARGHNGGFRLSRPRA